MSDLFLIDFEDEYNSRFYCSILHNLGIIAACDRQLTPDIKLRQVSRATYFNNPDHPSLSTHDPVSYLPITLKEANAPTPAAPTPPAEDLTPRRYFKLTQLIKCAPFANMRRLS